MGLRKKKKSEEAGERGKEENRRGKEGNCNNKKQYNIKTGGYPRSQMSLLKYKVREYQSVAL